MIKYRDWFHKYEKDLVEIRKNPDELIFLEIKKQPFVDCFGCSLKTACMIVLMIVNRFLNQLKPAYRFAGSYCSQLKLHCMFEQLLQRGASRNFVARCHLLRKCPVCIINGSPQASLLRPISATSCPLPRLIGQALTRLVTVSSMCCHTSTPALSTSSSSRGFTS